jgi:hypothetical protein
MAAQRLVAPWSLLAPVGAAGADGSKGATGATRSNGATYGNIRYANGGAFFVDVTPPQTIATANCANTAILCAGPFA